MLKDTRDKQEIGGELEPGLKDTRRKQEIGGDLSPGLRDSRQEAKPQEQEKEEEPSSTDAIVERWVEGGHEYASISQQERETDPRDTKIVELEAHLVALNQRIEQIPPLAYWISDAGLRALIRDEARNIIPDEFFQLDGPETDQAITDNYVRVALGEAGGQRCYIGVGGAADASYAALFDLIDVDVSARTFSVRGDPQGIDFFGNCSGVAIAGDWFWLEDATGLTWNGTDKTYNAAAISASSWVIVKVTRSASNDAEIYVGTDKPAHGDNYEEYPLWYIPVTGAAGSEVIDTANIFDYRNTIHWTAGA